MRSRSSGSCNGSTCELLAPTPAGLRFDGRLPSRSAFPVCRCSRGSIATRGALAVSGGSRVASQRVERSVRMFLALSALALPGPLRAGSSLPEDVVALAARADRVVLVRVEESRGAGSAGPGVGRRVGMCVEEDLRGGAPPRFTLRVLGGERDAWALRLAGAPALPAGARLIVFARCDRASADAPCTRSPRWRRGRYRSSPEKCARPPRCATPLGHALRVVRGAQGARTRPPGDARSLGAPGRRPGSWGPWPFSGTPGRRPGSWEPWSFSGAEPGAPAAAVAGRHARAAAVKPRSSLLRCVAAAPSCLWLWSVALALPVSRPAA